MDDDDVRGLWLSIVAILVFGLLAAVVQSACGGPTSATVTHAAVAYDEVAFDAVVAADLCVEGVCVDATIGLVYELDADGLRIVVVELLGGVVHVEHEFGATDADGSGEVPQ